MNNFVIGVIGAKGEGKTYFINHVLIPYLKSKGINKFISISAENIKLGQHLDDYFISCLQEVYNNYSGYTLIIDDLDLWNANIWSFFNTFIIRIRNRKINLIYSIKRPVLISHTLFQSTDYIFLFHTLESDLEKFNKLFGVEFKNPEKGSYKPFYKKV